MDKLMRIRDVFLDYMKPTAKRRRIFGPHTSTETKDLRLLLETKHSEISRNNKAFEISCPKYSTQSKRLNLNKRPRQDFEEDLSCAPFELAKTVLEDSQVKIKCEVNFLNDKLDIEENKILLNFDAENCSKSIESKVLEGDESERQILTNCEITKKDSMDTLIQEHLNRQVELALSKSDVVKFKASRKWHPDEIFLFKRLSLRGFEVLLPKSWKIDFPTLPHEIFAQDDNTHTFVNTNFTSAAYGVKALQSLLHLGARVRDNLVTGAPTNKLISREINNYIKWSERDGDYFRMRFLPVLTMVVARSKPNIESLSADIDSQMRFLAQKYRSFFRTPDGQIKLENETNRKNSYIRKPPLLYGIIVARAIIILVTLDSAKEDAAVRHMQHFDFRQEGDDAWIGFAIAIVVIVARNYLMRTKNELEVDESEIDFDL